MLKLTITLTLILASLTGNLMLSNVFNIQNQITANAESLKATSNNWSYSTTFTANSGGAKDRQPGQGKTYMGVNLVGMWVSPAGKTYYNSPVDEGNKTGVILDVNGNFDGSFVQDGDYGRTVGGAVSTNSKYIYQSFLQRYECVDSNNMNQFGNKRYPCGEGNWYGIRRYNIDRTQGTAPFPTGVLFDASMLKLGIKGTYTDNPPFYTGANGVFATETKLFISDYYNNTVRIFDSETMIEISSFNVPSPDEITMDKNNNIWVISKPLNSNGTIKQFTQNGTFIKEITIIANPKDITVNSQNELYVADASSDSNIKVFGNLTSTPVMNREIGNRGGIYVSSGGKKPGEAGDMRFQNLQSVKVDAQDNLYIGQAIFTSTVVEKYNVNNSLAWRKYGITFVNNSAIDPLTERSYSHLNYENMDYSKYNGAEASYGGTTIDPYKYPDDKRLKDFTYATVRVVNKSGIKYLYMIDPSANSVLVYKITSDSEIAKPFAELSRSPVSNNGSVGSIWQDANDNGIRDTGETIENNNFWSASYGWFVDINGDIYQANTRDYVAKFSFSNNNYSYSNTTKTAFESNFAGQVATGINRILYENSTDTMYLFGFFPNGYEGNDGTTAGRGMKKYKNWSTNPTLEWTKYIPYDINRTSIPPLLIKAVALEGDYIFLVEVFSNTSYARNTYIFDKVTGNQITTLQPDVNIVGDEVGWVDHSFGMTVYKRNNGEYIISTEDDQYNKSVVYRLNDGNVSTPTQYDQKAGIEYKEFILNPTTNIGSWQTQYKTNNGTSYNTFKCDDIKTLTDPTHLVFDTKNYLGVKEICNKTRLDAIASGVTNPRIFFYGFIYKQVNTRTNVTKYYSFVYTSYFDANGNFVNWYSQLKKDNPSSTGYIIYDAGFNKIG